MRNRTDLSELCLTPYTRSPMWYTGKDLTYSARYLHTYIFTYTYFWIFQKALRFVPPQVCKKLQNLEVWEGQIRSSLYPSIHSFIHSFIYSFTISCYIFLVSFKIERKQNWIYSFIVRILFLTQPGLRLGLTQIKLNIPSSLVFWGAPINRIIWVIFSERRQC